MPHGIRPTTARSKEVLFALIQRWIPDSTVIDSFCGSGVLGLECLSRGARHAYFIDRSNRCIQTVRDNIDAIGAGDSTTVIQGDAFRMLKKLTTHGQQVDLILADPPYEADLSMRTAKQVAESGILVSGGILVVEFRKGERLIVPAGLSLVKSKILGDTGLAVLEA